MLKRRIIIGFGVFLLIIAALILIRNHEKPPVDYPPLPQGKLALLSVFARNCGQGESFTSCVEGKQYSVEATPTEIRDFYVNLGATCRPENESQYGYSFYCSKGYLNGYRVEIGDSATDEKAVVSIRIQWETHSFFDFLFNLE